MSTGLREQAIALAREHGFTGADPVELEEVFKFLDKKELGLDFQLSRLIIVSKPKREVTENNGG